MTKDPKMSPELQRFHDEAKIYVSAHGGEWHAVDRGSQNWIDWMAYLLWRGLSGWVNHLRKLQSITMPCALPQQFDAKFSIGIEEAKRKVQNYEANRLPAMLPLPTRMEIAAKYGIRVEDAVTASDIVDMANGGIVRFALGQRKRERTMEEIIRDATLPAPLSAEAVRAVEGRPHDLNRPATPHSASQAASVDLPATTLPDDDPLPF